MEGAWHTSIEPVVPQERPTKSGKKRRGAAKSWGGRGPDAQDSRDEDGNRQTALQADKQRKASEKQAQKSKVYDVDDPSTWKVSDLTTYLKTCKVASSGAKKTLIQRVIDHKAGLLGTRVGEKRTREESGGVIEDGDVEAGTSAEQARGSQEGDTAGGGGEGDVEEDGEGLSDGFQYFDEDEDLSEDEDDDYADSDDSGDQ